MGKCVLCLEETNNKVNDNIGGKSYLCDKCMDKFEQCKVCGEYFYKDEIEDGLCESCLEEANWEEI